MQHNLVGFVQLSLGAVGQHVFDHDRVGLVTNLEHVGHLDQSEALECGLQIIESLTEVT